MTFIESFLQEYDAEMSQARKLLERVPDDKLDWAPHPKSMNLARLAGHVAGFPEWTLITVQTDTLDLQPGVQGAIPASKAEILEKFDNSLPTARQAISQLKEDQLAATWTLKVSGQQIFSIPRSEVLRRTVMNHMIHHRGQLTVYLRLLDVPIPGMYGPSADEM